MPNKNIIQEQVNYVRGLNLANDATTPDILFTVSAGACQDSTGTNDLVLGSAVTVNCGTTGANAVDIGTFDVDTYLAASSTYAVYIIGDSTGFNDVAAIASLDFSAPLLPRGYDMYRRIGWVFTDSAKDLKAFMQYGKAETREYVWNVPQAAFADAANDANPTALPAANATLLMARSRTGFAAELLAAPSASKVRLDVQYNPALVTSAIDMQAYKATPEANGQVHWLPGLAINSRKDMECHAGVNGTGAAAKAAITWKATAADPALVNVIGWTEYLG